MSKEYDFEFLRDTLTIIDICEISELSEMIGRDEAYINRMIAYPERYKLSPPEVLHVAEKRKIFMRRDCIQFAKEYKELYNEQ